MRKLKKLSKKSKKSRKPTKSAIKAVREIMRDPRYKDKDELLTILSAFRGPDGSGNEKDKATYTAPIRKWLLGNDMYNAMSFDPMRASMVATLTKDKYATLSDGVYRDGVPSGFHFASHIGSALCHIAIYEGWGDGG